MRSSSRAVVAFAATLLLPALVAVGAAPAPTAAPAALPGLQTGPAPWRAEIAHLRERLAAIGLPALSEEGAALHSHQHLDVLVDGKRVTVPAGIGIDEKARFIAPIHTHDAKGIIHIESDAVRPFTLGEFFDVWGVRLTASCVGGYCVDASHVLEAFVNGERVVADPRTVPLEPHAEIALVYRAKSRRVSVPKSYAFPEGL